MLLSKVARSAPTVDLTAYALDDVSMQWLEDRLGSRRPKVSSVDSLARSALAPHELEFMNGLLAVMRAGGRDVSVSIKQSGAGEAQRAGFMQATLEPKTIEAAQVAQTRRALQGVLWGQERHLEAFCLIPSDIVSPTRKLAPVLVIGGDRGHGQTEAVAALADSLNTGEASARVHAVDLSTATDASAVALFGDEGPLSEKTLRELVNRGVVCFHGANELTRRAPKVAERLQSLLVTPRTDPTFKPLAYVFEFEQLDPEGLVTTMGKALGSVGNRIASSYATFDHLDAATMRRYCDARLPDLIQSKDLGDIRIDLDDKARDVIAAALATPHAPLEDLDERLFQLVLSHVDVANDGSQRRPRAVQVRAAASPEETARIVANLTSQFPDLTLARKLLRAVPIISDHVPAANAPLPTTKIAPLPTVSVPPDGSDLKEVLAEIRGRWRTQAWANPGSYLNARAQDQQRCAEAIGRLLEEGPNTADDFLPLFLERRIRSLEPATTIAILAQLDSDKADGKGALAPLEAVNLARVAVMLAAHASPSQRELMRSLATRVSDSENGVKFIGDLVDRVAETTAVHLARATAREDACDIAKRINKVLADYQEGHLVSECKAYVSLSETVTRGSIAEANLLSVAVTDICKASVLGDHAPGAAAFDLVRRPIASIAAQAAVGMMGRLSEETGRGDYDKLVSDAPRGLPYGEGPHPQPVVVALELVRLAEAPSAEQLGLLETLATDILERIPTEHRLDGRSAAYKAILAAAVAAKKEVR